MSEGKKFFYLRYTDKQVRIAKRRAYENTEEFKDRYRRRAGAEATMSEYDRKTGVKNLRIRGLKNVRYCATLKATAINISRAAAARKKGRTSGYTFLNRQMHHFHRIFRFISHFFKIQRQMNKIHCHATPVMGINF